MIQPEDIAEAVRFLLRTSRNCIVPELQFIRPGDSRGVSSSRRASRSRSVAAPERETQPGPRPHGGTLGCGARAPRGTSLGSELGQPPRGRCSPRASLERVRARARWPAAAGRALGVAVPGAREAGEVGAAAVAVGGEHRADAAVAVRVGADDDAAVRRIPSSIARRVVERQAVDGEAQVPAALRASAYSPLAACWMLAVGAARDSPQPAKGDDCMRLGLNLGYWGLGLTAEDQLALVREAEAARVRLGVGRRGLRLGRRDRARLARRPDRADQARLGDLPDARRARRR